MAGSPAVQAVKPDDQDRWRVEVFDIVLKAIAEAPDFASGIVLKGAQVLARRLGGAARVSLDLDATLAPAFVRDAGDPAAWAARLESGLRTALERSFERMNPSCLSLERIRAERKPATDHPHGWDGVVVSLTLSDRRLPGVRNFPRITMDFSAPEELSPDSTSPLPVNDRFVTAYTLERIAAEKLRALLQSLPTWRRKTGGSLRAPRVRDIHDLARILAARGPADVGFWNTVPSEFRLACRSRFVDCAGMSSFESDREAMRELYEKNPTLPIEISFEAAWGALKSVVGLLEARGAIPVAFPMPGERR